MPDIVVKPDTTEKVVLRQPDGEAIADLAYHYWQERGCTVGSPAEDWYRAERVLRERGKG